MFCILLLISLGLVSFDNNINLTKLLKARGVRRAKVTVTRKALKTLLDRGDFTLDLLEDSCVTVKEKLDRIQVHNH